MPSSGCRRRTESRYWGEFAPSHRIVTPSHHILASSASRRAKDNRHGTISSLRGTKKTGIIKVCSTVVCCYCYSTAYPTTDSNLLTVFVLCPQIIFDGVKTVESVDLRKVTWEKGTKRPPKTPERAPRAAAASIESS